MIKTIEAIKTKQINSKLYMALLVAFVIGRLAIAFCQRVFLMPDGAGLDDGLMFSAAQSIMAGEWLGPYTAYTMTKTMGYALWLCLVHISGVPYLVANTLLWLVCCAFAVWALRPVIKGNLLFLIVFAALAFLPTSFAFFTLRVYRDAVFSSFCLLLFAGVLGLALRVNEKKKRERWVLSTGVGVGLVGIFLLREDGMVLLPFAVCGLGFLLVYAFTSKEAVNKKQLIVQCLLPFLYVLAGTLFFSLANWAQYGVLILNENTQGAFPKAYGAITAVAKAESDFQPLVPVQNEVLDKLFEEVPSLAKLEPALREGPAYNGYYNKELDAYEGSFYYGLRLAAYLEGLTPDAASGQAYWQDVYDEVEAAVAEGRLQSVPAGQNTLPHWNAALFLPMMQEVFSSLKMTLLFEEIDFRPILSEDKYEDAQEMAAWLNTVPQEIAYEEGSDALYYNPLQKIVFLFCDVLVWAYRVLIWPLLAVALFQMGKGIKQGIRRTIENRRLSAQLLFAVLTLGLLLSYLLRLFVASYLEVAAFDIGTYLMYLASGMPALMLFCVFGALQNEALLVKEEIE